MKLQKAWIQAGEELGVYSDKGGVHTYLEIYEQLFAYKKNNAEMIKLLEIGIKQGSSLLMWNKYFNENVLIDGIDVDSVVELDNYTNMMCHELDAYTDKAVDFFKTGNFDIIIDDGSHKLNDMIFVIQNYLLCLNSKGILVIEDIKTKFLDRKDYKKKLLESIPKELRRCSYLVDRRFINKRQDEVLLIINKEML